MARISLQAACDQARQAIETSSPERAIAIAEHLLTEWPHALEVYRILGEAYLANRQLDQAEAAFSQVLAADPENIPAHVGLGITYERQGRLDRAVPEFEHALEIKPDVPELRSQLLRLYTEAWGSENAQLRLSRAGLARLYARGHMYDQAVAEFQSVVADDPTRLDARVALAETLWREGRSDEAAAACRAILTGGNVLKAHLLLGYLGLAAKDPDAQQSWNAAYQLDPYQTVARQMFEQLGDTTNPEPLVEEWDEHAWQERRFEAEAAATRVNEKLTPEASAALPATPSITTPLPELTTPDHPEQPEPAAEPEPVLMGEPTSSGWFDTLDAPPASSGVTADYDDFLAGLLANSGFVAPSAAAGAAGGLGAASAASLDLDGDLPHFSIDDLDEGPSPTSGASAQSLQPFSLSDLGISDDEFASFGGAGGPETHPDARVGTGGTESRPDTPSAEPEMTPFSLADLGLDDDEIASVERTGGAQAQPDTSAEPEMTPFSLADLGLDDDEIASLDSTLGGTTADTRGSQIQPDTSAEPEMTPFSLADLGLDDDEIASLNSAGRSQTSPTTPSTPSAEPEMTPFSLADLGLDDDEIASLDSAIAGAAAAPATSAAAAADDLDTFGFSPFSLDDLDMNEPTPSAPAAQTTGSDLPAELRPFSLDELDFGESSTPGQGGLPDSLEPFSFDEREPSVRPGSSSAFNPQDPNEEDAVQGGYSWQQPAQRLRPSYLDSVARVGEGEENSIFGKLKQRRQSGALGPLPEITPPEQPGATPEDALLFSDDNVSLRDDLPISAPSAPETVEEGFASGEIQPFSLGDLGLNEDEIAALGFGTTAATASPPSGEPAPFNFADLDLEPAAPSTPAASAPTSEPAPFNFADFDLDTPSTPAASAAPSEPAPFNFADFDLDTPSTPAASAAPSEPAPFNFTDLDAPSTSGTPAAEPAPFNFADFDLDTPTTPAVSTPTSTPTPPAASHPAIDLTNDEIESESVTEALATGEIKPFSFADLGLTEEEARALGMLPDAPATPVAEAPALAVADTPTSAPEPNVQPTLAAEPIPAAAAPEPAAATSHPAIDLTNDAIESESVSDALATGEIKPFSFADLGLTEEEARALGMLPDAPAASAPEAAAPAESNVQPLSMDDLGISADDMAAPQVTNSDPNGMRLGLTSEDLDSLDLDGLNWDLPPAEPPAPAVPQPAAEQLTTGDLMLDRLLALGREQGFVDIADIMAGIEDPEAEADRIEEIGRRLHEANIQIRDGNEIIDMDADYSDEDAFAEDVPTATTDTSATAAFALSDLGLSEADFQPTTPAAADADDEFAFGDLSLLDELDTPTPAAAAVPPPAPDIPVAPPVAPVTPPVAAIEPPAAPVAPAEPPAPIAVPAPVVPAAAVPPAPAVPAKPAASGGWAGRLAGFEEQLSTNPGNHPLRLSLARFTAQASQIDASVKHYKQLVRQGVLLDDITADLQDLIEDEPEPEVLRKLHRLLGDTYARQGMVDDAMREYNWTVS